MQLILGTVCGGGVQLSQQHLLQDQLVQAVPAQLAGGLTCGEEQWLWQVACTTMGSGVPDPGETRPGANLDEDVQGLCCTERLRAKWTARQGQPLQLTPVS